MRSLVQLDRFQVRRAPKWDELADMANAGPGNQGDIDGRLDVMRDVRTSLNASTGQSRGKKLRKKNVKAEPKLEETKKESIVEGQYARFERSSRSCC